MGYKANINFSKLGYEYYKVLMKLNNLEITDQLYNWILTDPNVVYYDKFIGGSDFEFDIEIESIEKFMELLGKK